MKIRIAKKEDISGMLHILKKNNKTYSRDLALRELKEMFATSLIKPTYILVEEEREIVAFGGFIPSWADNMIFNIFWVNTHPEYRNRGIASELITNIIKRIKKIKSINVKMIVISTDIPAFYKKFGFKKIVPNYDKNHSLMSLKI